MEWPNHETLNSPSSKSFNSKACDGSTSSGERQLSLTMYCPKVSQVDDSGFDILVDSTFSNEPSL